MRCPVPASRCPRERPGRASPSVCSSPSRSPWRRRAPRRSRAARARRLPLTRWVVAALLVAALTPGAVRLLPVPAGPQWTVAMCAVGQGDALLLRPGTATAAEATVLIDTGPDPAALRQCLDRL